MCPMLTFKVVDIKLKRLRKAGDETTAVCGVFIKRAIKCLGKRVWRKLVISLSLRTCHFRPSFTAFYSVSYRRLKRTNSDSFVAEMRDFRDLENNDCKAGFHAHHGSLTPFSEYFCGTPSGPMTPSTDAEADDTVILKISLLGDSETGKTSFMVKYATSQRIDKYVPTEGISCMEKVFRVKGAKIAFNIWDLGGHQKFKDTVHIACQDSAAILFIFDLTRRSTLNSVMEWYQQARRYNQIALPVMIGTKFDQFVNLPNDIQLTIVKQATVYAQAMDGVLFFSSVTHNINVQKIFKVITAKLFDLPCNIAKNSTVGEPIVFY